MWCACDSVWRLMRVGEYVDAFNLCYGVVLTSVVGYLAGDGLILRALVSALVGAQAALWKQARVTQVEDHLVLGCRSTGPLPVLAVKRVDVLVLPGAASGFYVLGDKAVTEGYPPCWGINGLVTRL